MCQQPALLRRKQRSHPRTGLVHRYQRLRLDSNASFERRMQQDIVRSHGHGYAGKGGGSGTGYNGKSATLEGHGSEAFSCAE
jgi:hypothetical protein